MQINGKVPRTKLPDLTSPHDVGVSGKPRHHRSFAVAMHMGTNISQLPVGELSPPSGHARRLCPPTHGTCSRRRLGWTASAGRGGLRLPLLRSCTSCQQPRALAPPKSFVPSVRSVSRLPAAPVPSPSSPFASVPSCLCTKLPPYT